MRRAVPCIQLCALLLTALSGCASQEADRQEDDPAGVLVEGWVLDVGLKPVPGARAAVSGSTLENRTDAEGHYSLVAPAGLDIVLVVEAEGFLPRSQAVSRGAGDRHVLNFTLERVPDAEPYTRVESFEGVLRCAATVVLQEDPNRPHEHQGVRCGDYLPEEASQNVWRYDLPLNATGVVFEVVWTPQTELSQALVLKAEVEGTGQVLGFLEGQSIVRLQLPAFPLAELLRMGETGLVLTILPGAGTGSHEHGAAGLFLEQDFTIYSTTFYNQPADPTYSIADRE